MLDPDKPYVCEQEMIEYINWEKKLMKDRKEQTGTIRGSECC